MIKDSPLGQDSEYPDQYAPELLYPIARADSRRSLGVDETLPFHGQDIWNAWELTWLATNGRPDVAVAEIRVPADSPNIIESKSLKLYLNSYSMSRFESQAAVASTIARDLSEAAGANVEAYLNRVDSAPPTDAMPGDCIDDDAIDCDAYEVDPSLLRAVDDDLVTESLHSHLLRSLCPVTSQPDAGSLLIQYTGPRLDRAALLRYIVSFRQHNDFHEACVERMFLDIRERCQAEELTVYARYQRRGGIDINPWRSTGTARPDNLRLWRQ